MLENRFFVNFGAVLTKMQQNLPDGTPLKTTISFLTRSLTENLDESFQRC